MAITNASRLADFGSGIGAQGAIIQVDNASQEVGIGTTNPNATLTVGNIGASGTSIYVHGSASFTGGVFTGAYDPANSATSGLSLQDSGRVIARRQTGSDVVWLGLHGSTTGSEITAAGAASFASSSLDDSAVRGINNTTYAATINAKNYGTGDVFAGYNGSGTKTSDISSAGDATFAGNISIGGTLTYEDVTNIDSIGIITARSGIRIGAGQSIGSDGALTYYGDGSNLTGVDSTALKDGNDVVRVQANTSGAVVTGVITATSLSGAELVNYSEKVNLLNNTGSAATINVEDGNFVVATLDNDCTFTFSSVTSGKFYSFGLQLTNSGGSHSITWPTSVKWPGDSLPSRTTTSGRSDVYGFYTTDGGSNWYGSISQYNYN